MPRLGLLAAFILSVASPVFGEDSNPGDWTAPEVMEFGDWSVACDNARECTAVSVSRDYRAKLENNDAGDYASPKMWVKRRAGPNEKPRVYVDTKTWDETNPLGTLSLHIYRECDGDCTGRAYSLSEIETGRYELEPRQVARFFAESVETNLAATRRSDRSMHGIITTRGLIAAMRYIDEVQQRRGTVTAIFAKGKKPAATVPAEPKRPGVRIMRGLDEPSTEMPYHGEAIRIRNMHCRGPGDFDETNIQRFRLRNGQNLWSVVCSANLPNPTHLWLVETGAEQFEIFKLPRPEQGRAAEMPILPHALYDPASGQLTGYHKGDDVRRCGWKRRWVWTGSAFEMIDAIEMPACIDIPVNQWLQTYRAIPL